MGLNTKLTDVGAAISVVTAKFIEDTGSTNLSDVLVYQTNMEVKGFGGSLSGVTPSLGGGPDRPGAQRPRARHVRVATMPVCASFILRWKEITAARVRDPNIPSTVTL